MMDEWNDLKDKPGAMEQEQTQPYVARNYPGMQRYSEREFKHRTLHGCRVQVKNGAEPPHRRDVSSPSHPPRPATPSRGHSSRPRGFGGNVTLHHVTVHVERGDITKKTADVLVGAVNENLSLNRSGQVAKSFNDQGGDGLQQELDNYKEAKKAKHAGKIIFTKGGFLPCKTVYHVVAPDRLSNEDYTKTIREALEMAWNHGDSSIALTTMGVQHFGNDSVAKMQMDAIRQFADNTRAGRGAGTMAVYLMAWDDNSYQAYSSAVGGTGAGSDFIGQRRDTPPRDHHVQRHASPADFRARRPRQEAGSLTFIITGPKDKYQDVVRDIERTLKTNFRKEETDYSAELSAEAEDRGLSVEKGSMRGQMRVLGEKQAVERILRKVQRRKKELEDPEVARGQVSRDTYLDLLMRARSVPLYWKHRSRHSELKTDLKVQLTNLTDRALYKAVQDLVLGTWDPRYIGRGKDASGLDGYLTIQIKNIQVVENALQLREYMDKRRRFLEEHLRGKTKYSPFEDVFAKETAKLGAGTRHGGKLLTSATPRPALDDVLVREINEIFSFHGTLPDTSKLIAKQKLDGRLNTKGWYGKALYLGDSSTKADQYADPTDARDNSTDKYMFVVRTMLGHIKLSVNPNKDLRRAPCRHCDGLVDACRKHTDISSFSNSLVHVGPSNNFREIVIYDDSHCYPEFLVTYRRM